MTFSVALMHNACGYGRTPGVSKHYHLPTTQPAPCPKVNYIVCGRALAFSKLNVGCLRPQWISRVFLLSDIITFLIQVSSEGRPASLQGASFQGVTLTPIRGSAAATEQQTEEGGRREAREEEPRGSCAGQVAGYRGESLGLRAPGKHLELADAVTRLCTGLGLPKTCA